MPPINGQWFLTHLEHYFCQEVIVIYIPTRRYINTVQDPTVVLRRFADSLESFLPLIKRMRGAQINLKTEISTSTAQLEKTDKHSPENAHLKNRWKAILGRYNDHSAKLSQKRIEAINSLWEIQVMVLTIYYRLAKQIDSLNSKARSFKFKQNRNHGEHFKAEIIGHINNLKSEMINYSKSLWEISKYHERGVLSPQLLKEISFQSTSVMLRRIRSLTIAIDNYNKITESNDIKPADISNIIKNLHQTFLHAEQLAHKSKILIHRFHTTYIGHDQRAERVFQSRLQSITNLWRRLYSDINRLREYRPRYVEVSTDQKAKIVHLYPSAENKKEKKAA